MTLSFWAIAIATLAKVIAITFGAPLFATLIAVVTLGESFRPRRAVALAVLGALGSLTHLCFAEAFKEADMSAVLPLEYAQLEWVAAIGFAAFGEVPDVWTWVGAALIVAGAGYLAVRES